MSNISPPRRAPGPSAARKVSAAEPSKDLRPTFLDLLVGAPFADGSPEADAASLASWLLLHSEATSIPELHRDLHLLACAQTPASLAAASAACRKATADPDVVEDADLFADAADLFDYYGACVGDADAALRVAACAVSTVGHPGIDARTGLERGLAALGWLWFAASGPGCTGTEPVRPSVLHAAEDILDRMTQSRGAPRRRSALAQPPSEDTFPEFTPRYTDFADAPSQYHAFAEERLPKGKVIVLRSVGNPETVEGKRVVAAYHGLTGKPLPLAPTPDLKTLHQGLLEDYPHAHAAIEAIVGELVGKDHVALPPVVLVGEPGVGKTQLAVSLLDALHLPNLLVSCGGANDSALGGTSRRWLTGEPSAPMTLIAAHRTASPGVILDELDKPAGADTNGRLHDALLGMLEPLTAARWHDPYLEAEVDLSHVVWIATANDVSRLPRPLRDRCRILQVPQPGPEHLPGLAASLLRQQAQANGRHPRWHAPLDGMELRAVAAAWPGGSIRRLARLLDGVLAARSHSPVLN